MAEARTVLVSGASVAGAAVAFWFSRIGWDVVLLERAEGFRTGGQNIDVRGTAREVLDRMGLTDEVRSHTTTEVGTRFVDETGGSVGEFGVTEGGGDGPTAELEILRGDLARLVADELPDEVRWIFGTTIHQVDEDDDGVTVGLADGETLRCDLLVVAEGVRSTTRDLLLRDEVERDEIGMTIAYGTIPRSADDDRWWRWFTAPGSRQASLRPDNHGTTRATLAFLSKDRTLDDTSRETLVEGLRAIFDGVGWEVPRVLDGFATSDDVYVDDLTQVDLRRYSTGRVVVTGDAAWCVTPLAGGGASLALVGAYALAACVSTAGTSTGGTASGMDTALEAYEEWMRPLVEQVQDLPPGVPGIALPSSELGVAVQRAVTRLASSRPVRAVASRVLGGGTEAPRPLPEIRLPA